MTVNRRQVLALTAGSAIGAAAPLLHAQSAWPSKPVRFVVPFAPGGTSEIVARSVAAELSKQLGQNVYVENKPGGAGVTAMSEVAKAAPDGHTLLLAAAPFTTVPAALPGAGYDPIAGFTPVGMFAHGPLVWAASKDLPANTLSEVVALARSQPGRLNYGSAGVGGINHLVLESLKAHTGTFITHIPYRGIAPATVDTLSGQIQLLTGTIPALAPYIRDGRLKALAVTSQGRSPALPQVPGMQESGFADVNVLNYFALVAPKGTPDAVVQQINAALAQVVAMPDVKERLAKDALEPATGTPAQLAQFLLKDVDGWKRVVERQKLKIDAF